VLDEQGSLLRPGRSIWTPSNLDELYDRVIGHPDLGAGSFTDKLVRQTRGASSEIIQLASEALFVFHLKDAETPATTKRVEIQRVLEGMPDPPAIPDELAAALESGVARYGRGKLHKRWHFTYLLRFARRWLELGSDQRRELREDAWVFREFLEQIKVQAGGFQQDAIMHLVHPEVFEPIISRGDKRAIVGAFGNLVSEPTSDPDRALQQIRAALAGGPDFHFGTVAFAVTAFEQRDCRHENSPPSSHSNSADRLRRLPLPDRGDHARVRWYLRFGLSYRDVEELLAERGVEVDHVTVHRWVQRFAPLLAEAARPAATP
jgi:hypothetical protein